MQRPVLVIDRIQGQHDLYIIALIQLLHLLLFSFNAAIFSRNRWNNSHFLLLLSFIKKRTSLTKMSVDLGLNSSSGPPELIFQIEVTIS